jgi:uncharacterized membrane protein
MTLREKMNSTKVLLTILGIMVLVLCYQSGVTIQNAPNLFSTLVWGVVVLVGGYGIADVGQKYAVAKATESTLPPSPPLTLPKETK